MYQKTFCCLCLRYLGKVSFNSIENQIISHKKLIPPPHEPGILPKWIAQNGVTDVIVGGVGDRAIKILQHFPNVDTDNHFNGIGLHGVYDSKFERIIITKLLYFYN